MMEVAFIGLRGVYVTGGDEIAIGDGLSLVRPNDFLLSARSREVMSGLQYQAGEQASRYLVFRSPQSSISYDGGQEVVGELQNGLMAFQIVKPVQTLGIIFYGTDDGGAEFNLRRTEHRSPTDAGDWARVRRFDDGLLVRVPALVTKINQVMAGQIAETKNAIFLLQMGLEHSNPLIAGLLWVMGLDAILGGQGRDEFKDRLCAHLGPRTLVFPDWNQRTQPPQYTVEEVALHLFILRNKLAHGVDLRKAAQDKSTPVDLTRNVTLTEFSQPATYAMVLSQAACFLLCRVLEKTL
jgi:hypothetical protein